MFTYKSINKLHINYHAYTSLKSGVYTIKKELTYMQVFTLSS